jgi:hypothetical protein
MRNLAISADAAFETTALCWMKSDLPISLPWRSVLWRTTAPTLWLFGLAFWIWAVGDDTPKLGLIVDAWLFMGMPVLLGISALWWLQQWLLRRQAGTLVINDDYLEWQFEMGSNVDLLTDCGPFELVGKQSSEAHIEWEVATSWDQAADQWPRWARRWRRPDRALYGRDLGLDRDNLESLCKLLNELREAAKAQR